MKFVRLFSILLAGILLAACSAKDNMLPPAPLVHFTPTVHVQQLWSNDVGNGASKYYLRLRPAVDYGKVFAPDYDGDVIAVDAASGHTVWKEDIAKSLTSGVSTDRGRVFVATGQGEVVALNQSDGKLLWRAPVSSAILTTPTSFKGVVLVKSLDGSLTALSENNGQQLWRFQQEVPSLVLHASSQPEVAGSLVVAGFANGRLAAINLMSGKSLWLQSIAEPQGSTAVERMVDIDVNPVVVNGVVYVATYQGNIAAIELKTGRLIWRHKVSSYAGITADFNRIYLSDSKSYMWAFDNDNGAVSWRQTKLLGRNITGPALLGNYVIVGDFEGYLHWMGKRTGKFAARAHLDNSGMLVAPVVSHNILYAYTADGILYAYRIVS